MRKSGSALVFVLIIIAGIVTVTIGTQHLSLVQFNQATREEDNVFALYAAKAGIEDGLLRFRYERDTETRSNMVHRFNVTNGDWVADEEVDKDRRINVEPNYSVNQYYDLAINFKGKQIGDFTNLAGSSQLPQDQEIELTGFPNNQGTYYLRYAFLWENANSCRAKGAFVQFQQVTTLLSGDSSSTQKIVNMPSAGDNLDSYVGGQNIPLTPSASLSTVLRLRAYHCPVRYAFTTARTNSGLGSGNNAGPLFDSLTTKITATGYFGEAKRTLEATVDRKSGRLISIYDFNLYSGQTCIGTDLSFLNSARCE